MQLQLSRKKILSSKHGISSYFLDLEDKGIKFFKNKRERNISLDRQTRAYFSGYAPKTGDIIDFDTFYGYYTEKAEMLTDIIFELTTKWEDRILDLCEDIANAIDFYPDPYWYNFGFINKNFVCVDFGDYDKASSYLSDYC